MMNYVWSGMILLACMFGVFTGNLQTVTAGALDGAEAAVKMILSLLGMMCLWTGLLEVAKRSGLTRALAKAAKPLIRILFPRLKADGAAASAIVMNMIANFLGLSNAATPLGLKAMQELDKLNGGSSRATDEMCMFIVINTASINLIPTTLITLRHAAASSDPFAIMVPVWICSILSVAAGVLAVKFFVRREESKRICRR